jgi:RecJ-like exonuclease
MVADISQLSKAAAKRVLSFPKLTRVRVVSHYDADGITSAGILCTALYRRGYDFHVSLMRNPFTQGLERLKAEGNELIIFSDMGSAQIEAIEEMGCPCIIIDHHQYLKAETKGDVVQINANLCGIDGNYEACGATMSYAFAVALDRCNEDLVSLALAGAIGDKQHIGGIKGFNKGLLDQALKQGFVTERIGVKLSGDSVADAVYFSIDPYYKELSGNKQAVETVLKQLRIDHTMKVEDIAAERMMRLQSYLLFTLIKAGVQRNILDTVIRTRYWSDRLGCELERFADLLDACGKGGNRGLGLSVCLGDSDAFTEAEQFEHRYKQKILDALLSLEKDGVHELDGLRYFYSDDSSLGGVICGIASNYLTDKQKPLFSLARKKDEIHVSCRGNQWLVQEGVDLGGALKQVTEAIGGHGGGHKIAAGATITRKKEEEFLHKVNTLLLSQRRK